jgi:hypothetical protein
MREFFQSDHGQLLILVFAMFVFGVGFLAVSI